jgi:hypothetical protein
MNLSTLLEFEKGRFYNESEANSGANVIVLGSEIASSLFEAVEPIGKNVSIRSALYRDWSVEETRCAAVWRKR